MAENDDKSFAHEPVICVVLGGDNQPVFHTVSALVAQQTGRGGCMFKVAHSNVSWEFCAVEA